MAHENLEEDRPAAYLSYFGPRQRDPQQLDDLAELFKLTAGTLRSRYEVQATAYNMWQASGLSNPRNQVAGSIGGTTAVANMNRDERRARARKGGNTVFHGDVDGSDGVRASARGRLLARKRWQTR